MVFSLILYGVVFGIAAFLHRLANLRQAQESEDAYGWRWGSRAVLVIAVMGLSLSIIGSFFKSIPAGSVGVSRFWGSTSQSLLSEGINIVNPFKEVVVVSTKVETRVFNSSSFKTKDMQTVEMPVAITYCVQPEKAAYFVNEGLDLDIIWTTKDTITLVNKVIQDCIAGYNIDDLMPLRSQITEEIRITLDRYLTLKHYLHIPDVVITNMVLDKAYEQNIANKLQASQMAQLKTFDLARTEADTKIAVIRAEAEARIAVAKATSKAEIERQEARLKADLVIIHAQAEADANTRVANSLSPLLLQQMWLRRWNGVLPQYYLAGDKGGLTFSVPLNTSSIAPVVSNSVNEDEWQRLKVNDSVKVENKQLSNDMPPALRILAKQMGVNTLSPDVIKTFADTPGSEIDKFKAAKEMMESEQLRGVLKAKEDEKKSD